MKVALNLRRLMVPGRPLNFSIRVEELLVSMVSPNGVGGARVE